jgi:hypothetical protein
VCLTATLWDDNSLAVTLYIFAAVMQRSWFQLESDGRRIHGQLVVSPATRESSTTRGVRKLRMENQNIDGATTSTFCVNIKKTATSGLFLIVSLSSEMRGLHVTL